MKVIDPTCGGCQRPVEALVQDLKAGGGGMTAAATSCEVTPTSTLKLVEANTTSLCLTGDLQRWTRLPGTKSGRLQPPHEAPVSQRKKEEGKKET